MDDHQLAAVELDPRFPSGPWTGYFLQYWLPGRHTTNLHLTCQGGELTGAGRDWVGPYTIAGTYDLATGRCAWTKQYTHRHAVSYRGVNDGFGIWGVWELPQLFGLFVDRGGFHIWPEGADVSEAADRTEQAVVAAMRDEFGSRALRIIRALVVLAAAAAGLALMVWRWGRGS